MKRVIGSTHPVFRDHDTGIGHPERPERLDAILSGLQESGLHQLITWVEPEEAAERALFRVHAEEHVRELLAWRGKSVMVDSDTIVSPSSVEAALRGTGAAIGVVEAVMGGDADYGFCFARPPGHHAERRRSMGFCLFNHVAAAAAHAVEELGARRVLIFDPDLHHGNGTQDIFYDRGDVFFISIHQWPFYPGTGAIDEGGAGDGLGKTVNVPLPAGSGDRDYQYVGRELVVRAIRRFKPDLVLFSAGFDAHEEDPLGSMRVTSSGFGDLYAVILNEMERTGIPGVFCLEGGYSLAALRAAVPAVVEVALNGGGDLRTPDIEPGPETRRVVDRLRQVVGGLG